MYIAKRKSTGVWINDFQEKATVEVLTRNAVAQGIPESDIDIADVTPEEYEAIKESVVAPLRAITEQQVALTREQLITVGQAVKTKLGLTNAQLKLFVRFIREIDLDSF